MRITKFGHACVRVEHEGATIVIDPGVFTEPEAVDGVDAVLITHQHPDHLSPDHLHRTDASIYTIDAVADEFRGTDAALAERVTVVAPEETFTAAGLPVRAVGELHAVIHPEFPRFTNSGYVITLGAQRIYHPGDALTVPGEPVDLLCTPISAPWLKVSEALDFVGAVGAPRNLAIHDKIYSDVALGMVDTHLGRYLSSGGRTGEYVRLADGDDLG